MLNFQRKNGSKGHQRSNLAQHYIQKFMLPGVLNFILASQTAKGWYFAVLLIEQSPHFIIL